MTFVEMHVKWSVILTDRLGPEILTVLKIRGQVLFASCAFACDGSWLVVELECAPN